MTGKSGSLDQYKAVTINTGIDQASPHRLIQMLLQGATDKIGLAKVEIARGETALKASHITSAHAILEGLQVSLDLNQGEDIAQNLHDLYDYMMRRLVQANLKNDVTILDELLELLGDIRSGWDGIAEQAEPMQQETSSPKGGGVSIGV